jgi:putative copper export protein
MHHILLVLHLLAATIWVGGHLILCVAFLPAALRNKEPQIIKAFEKKYEPLGIPSLAVLIITGILMAYNFGVPLSKWFSFSEPVEKVVSLKLSLLVVTFALAIHARVFIIPTLSEKTLPKMAFHIVLITIVGICMLIAGSFVRFGGL